MTTFARGELMVAIGTRGLRNFTKGKKYKCLYGTEVGLLEYQPYVTVIDDNGRKVGLHQERFEKVK